MEVHEVTTTKTEPLHTTLNITKESFGGLTGSIEIGNTGLRFVPIDEKDGVLKWVQHYTPDGYDPLQLGSKQSEPVKYSLVYAKGISATIDAFRSRQIPTTEQPALITGETVSKMNKFRHNLFGLHYQSKWAFSDTTPDGEILQYYKYSLDLPGLLKDEVVVKRIKKLAEKCESEHYTMIAK